jgi:hypothetical protein
VARIIGLVGLDRARKEDRLEHISALVGCEGPYQGTGKYLIRGLDVFMVWVEIHILGGIKNMRGSTSARGQLSLASLHTSSCSILRHKFVSSIKGLNHLKSDLYHKPSPLTMTTPISKENPKGETTAQEEITRCVCGFEDFQGPIPDHPTIAVRRLPRSHYAFIQCDGCQVWQHCACVGIAGLSGVDEYFCEYCRPELHLLFNSCTG